MASRTSTARALSFTFRLREFRTCGSLVVMTVWVFYASMIVFFGAELTYFRSERSRG
jgi:uncharacterized BrkB/YihY/UPF0761 family membrane protein